MNDSGVMKQVQCKVVYFLMAAVWMCFIPLISQESVSSYLLNEGANIFLKI